MHHIKNHDWLLTPKEETRGYIQPQSLKELWFHTGTNCNLRCPFCLEGSKPGDNRINFLTYEDVSPIIDESLELGVEKFSFTGGEPFVNPDMIKILDYALNHRTCLVLSNATEPLMNNIHRVIKLADKPNKLNFRVSLDNADEKKHDECRGPGNFRKALTTLSRLHALGFGVSVARLIEKDENVEQVNALYKAHFKSAELPDDMRIVAFPEFFPPGSIPDIPQITEHCMTTYLDSPKRANFMCNFSKMIVKKNNKVGVYACTLVDDDPDYNLGETLTESMSVRIMMRHHRCYSCFAYGSSCSELN